jgi:hypothetical protein
LDPPVSIRSPGKLKARTFRATFCFPAEGKPQGSKARRPPRRFRNPLSLAQGWQQALGSGEHSTQADFARRQGISRARVTQVLQLLNLAPDVWHIIAALGDPLCSRSITEHRLRCLVHCPAEEQRRQIGRILAKWRNPPDLRSPTGVFQVPSRQRRFSFSFAPIHLHSYTPRPPTC